MGSLEPAIGGAIDVATPPRRPLRQLREDGADAPPSRCYHRPSLRQFLRSTLRRARWGLFFALVPIAPILFTARSLRLHRQPTSRDDSTSDHGTRFPPREDPQYRDHGAHRRR